ncbi:MAG: prolyl oligopeptidase family serine peptidase [Balneolaceae bacterium]|nr:prolyl oligopeptidase family serine peptidase [Balneolaceae bacterium]
MSFFNRFCAVFLVLIFSFSSFLLAQENEKVKLEPNDYEEWQRITNTAFSNDGSWFAYNIELVDGDGWLMIKKVASDSTGEHKFMHGISPEFSENNEWAAFQIGVSEEEEKNLEQQNERVQYKLGLMNLASANVDTFENIQQFEFSETGNHIVMNKYKPEDQKGGGEIVVRNLQTGQNQLIGNVSEYTFNEEGTLLAIAIDASEKLGNGVQLLNLKNQHMAVLESDTANFKNLTWSEEENALAFVKAITNDQYKNKTHEIYAYRNLPSSTEANVFRQNRFEEFPADHRIVEFRDLIWTDDGNTIFFGIQEWEKNEKPTKPDTPGDSEAETDSTKNEKQDVDPDEDLDPTNVEIWHWQDDQIQPRQEVLQNSLKEENHLSAWHLDKDSFVQLGDSLMENVSLTGDHQHAVGYVEKPYEPTFEEEWRDIYLIDVNTGEREKILERREIVNTSPGGDYLLYFWDNEWRAYDIEERKEINLTGDVNTRFENYHIVTGSEQQPPFGNGRWAKDDAWILLYDEYDVYRATPDGDVIEKLTNGSQDSIRYRQVYLDMEDDFVEPDEALYFHMYGDYTKKRGYARLGNNDRLHTLLYKDQQINRLNKAKDAEKFIYSAESSTDSPDFFYVERDFNNPIELTNTNPQQENYYWADDELITFHNERGKKLQGRLLYPANYNPDKKYPMIVYIYERRSQDMHSYTIPTRTNPYNFRRFSSEGYFVFQPDITYELRDPGMSAVKSVLPAVEKVLETGMIDKDKLGLTGHSWGAYQTSFIITQTNMFNSAVAGAPLTNMVSMYNSIYWNSGMTDARIFEISQGRFPDPWWMDWDKFIDNSPIFNMKNTETPLLVEFGTDDGAVDFNQGVELYTTMRRMEKPFVMLVYEGENHGLAREENQIDYATRAFEWHDHYLNGKPAPKWIKEGLPYLQRPEIVEEDNGE